MTKTEEDITELLKKFFYYLDMTEESGSGRTFHPTIITSCRAMYQDEINNILKQLKEHVK